MTPPNQKNPLVWNQADERQTAREIIAKTYQLTDLDNIDEEWICEVDDCISGLKAKHSQLVPVIERLQMENDRMRELLLASGWKPHEQR